MNLYPDCDTLPVLTDGTGGDAARDASGLGQLFEQISVKGITDVPRATDGAAIIDLNKDGLLDLFIINSAGMNLLLNKGCFEFEPHPLALTIVGDLGSKGAPTFADFNNDGFLDFYVPTTGAITSPNRAQFFLSQGTWDIFKDYAVEMGVGNKGAYARGQVSVGDANQDGYLDFAIGANQIGSLGGGRPLSRFYIYQPADDGIYENGRFQDIGGTELIPGFGGVDYYKCDPEKDRNGFVVLLRDLDDDSDLDLIHMTHNDMLRTKANAPCNTGECDYGVYVWQNMLKETGEFRYNTIEPGENSLAEHGKMQYNWELGYYGALQHAVGHEGISTADVDNDGDLDVLTTGGTDPDWHVNSDMIAGKFWYNQGNFEFKAATTDAGLESLNWYMRDWAVFWDDALPLTDPIWPSTCPLGPQTPLCSGLTALDHQVYPAMTLFGDFDNDGWQDMLLSIRHVNSVYPGGYRNTLYMNNGDGTFRPTTTDFSGINEAAFAAQAADLNNDGLLDLYFLSRGGSDGGSGLKDIIFWNSGEKGGADNHWLQVKLQGLPDSQLIGAKICAYTRGSKQLLGRRDYVVDTLRGSHAPTVHFGLGKTETVDIKVILNNGKEYTFKNITADAVVALTLE